MQIFPTGGAPQKQSGKSKKQQAKKRKQKVPNTNKFQIEINKRPRSKRKTIVIAWSYLAQTFDINKVKPEKTFDRLTPDDLIDVMIDLQNSPYFKKDRPRSCYSLVILSFCIIVAASIGTVVFSVAKKHSQAQTALLLVFYALVLLLALIPLTLNVKISNYIFERDLVRREESFRRIAEVHNKAVYEEKEVRIEVGRYGAWLRVHLLYDLDKAREEYEEDERNRERRLAEHQRVFERRMMELHAESMRTFNEVNRRTGVDPRELQARHRIERANEQLERLRESGNHEERINQRLQLVDSVRVVGPAARQQRSTTRNLIQNRALNHGSNNQNNNQRKKKEKKEKKKKKRKRKEKKPKKDKKSSGEDKNIPERQKGGIGAAGEEQERIDNEVDNLGLNQLGWSFYASDMAEKDENLSEDSAPSRLQFIMPDSVAYTSELSSEEQEEEEEQESEEEESEGESEREGESEQESEPEPREPEQEEEKEPSLPSFFDDRSILSKNTDSLNSLDIDRILNPENHPLRESRTRNRDHRDRRRRSRRHRDRHRRHSRRRGSRSQRNRPQAQPYDHELDDYFSEVYGLIDEYYEHIAPHRGLHPGVMIGDFALNMEFLTLFDNRVSEFRRETRRYLNKPLPVDLKFVSLGRLGLGEGFKTTVGGTKKYTKAKIKPFRPSLGGLKGGEDVWKLAGGDDFKSKNAYSETGLKIRRVRKKNTIGLVPLIEFKVTRFDHKK